MPVSLLKLPFLVRALVVTELDYQEIFLISICSRRSNCLVKSARINVHKIAFLFGECHGYNTFDIGVVTDMLQWFPVTSLLHVPKLALENTLTVNLGLNYKADTK
ncbi:hypothetical protein B9Z55_016664 [Caenorhabditis nigoni]|uniref:F-box domain-containing protein n=1 Tax=Caenorhabditis nigoni TaxID=1611254 RepID=A0A2G5T646_9PELO|nr:hypothetical protein B9Z55_016664 [Caenorhabditis nigoni]